MYLCNVMSCHVMSRHVTSRYVCMHVYICAYKNILKPAWNIFKGSLKTRPGLCPAPPATGPCAWRAACGPRGSRGGPAPDPWRNGTTLW